LTGVVIRAVSVEARRHGCRHVPAGRRARASRRTGDADPEWNSVYVGRRQHELHGVGAQQRQCGCGASTFDLSASVPSGWSATTSRTARRRGGLSCTG
jgi:hypothetical protein